MKTSTHSLLFLALITASLAGCKQDQPHKADQPANVGIESAVVHPQQHTDYLEVPAHVTPDPSHVVRIFPPLSGRIFVLPVLPGQQVPTAQQHPTLQPRHIPPTPAD